jgi:hemolysin III
VFYQGAFYLAISAAAALIYLAPTARAAGAAAIYGASMAALFGIGALYHRPNWPPEARQVVRRIDHAAIFVFIAGSFTPLAMLISAPERSSAGLWIVWIGAGLGVVKSLLWARAPRMATVIPGALLALAVLWQAPQLSAGMGPGGLDLLLASAAIFGLGALVYVLRRPDPAPRVFGYHEVFHTLVILASGCHFVLVARVVLASG